MTARRGGKRQPRASLSLSMSGLMALMDAAHEQRLALTANRADWSKTKDAESYRLALQELTAFEPRAMKLMLKMVQKATEQRGVDQ